jgi:hypothetical protein
LPVVLAVLGLDGLGASSHRFPTRRSPGAQIGPPVHGREVAVVARRGKMLLAISRQEWGRTGLGSGGTDGISERRLGV